MKDERLPRMSDIKATRELSERNLILFSALLVGGGACLIFAGDLFHGSDLLFKAIRDPNPFSVTYPWLHFHRYALAQGHFPLWNPWNAMGTPYIANYQTGFFSPFLAPLYALPLWLISVPYLLLRLVLAGLGTALYLRKLGLKPQSCAIGAVAFGLSGWMIQYVNSQILVIDMLIPYLLLFLERLRAEKRLRDVLAFISLLTLVLVGGQPSSALFTIIFAGAYAVFMAGREGKTIIIFAISGAISMLLSFAQLAPFFELMAQGWTTHLPDYSLHHLRLSEIITLIAPGFFGYTSDNRIHIMQQLPYIGIIPALLCIMAALHFRNLSRQGRFFIIAILISLGFLHSLPIFSQIMSAPGLNRLSFFKYLQPLLAFSIAVCAAMALERAQNPNRSIIVMACFLILFLIWQTNRFPDARIFLFTSAGLVIIQLAAFRLFFKRKWALVFLAVLGLIIDSQFNRSGFFFNPEKHNFSFLEPFKSRAPDYHRIAATPDVLAPNYGALYEVSDLRLNEVLFVRRYIGYLEEVNKQTENQMRDYILPYNHTRVRPEPRFFKSELASRAGLRWFLSKNPLPPNRSIQKILQTGLIMAPGPDHVLNSQFEISGDSRPTLFQHPPSLITIPASTDSFNSILTAALALDPKVWNLKGDGAWFLCMNQKGLIYSRYIDPKKRRDERRWIPMEIKQPSGHGAQLCTLPGNDIFNDWFGWGDLRRNEVSAIEAEIYNGFHVYENENAFPLAFYADRVTWVPDAKTSKSLLDSLNRDEKLVIIEGLFPDLIQKYAPGEVRNISVNVDSFRLELDAKGDAALVITNTYFPGWQAWLDNKEVKIFPADHTFQGILVPKGKHKLELIYRPVAFRIGLWTSIVSLIFWLAIWRPRFFQED